MQERPVTFPKVSVDLRMVAQRKQSTERAKSEVRRKLEIGMTGADLLIASLYEQGVRTIFGMPGSHTTAIYDAIERHGGIRTILTRNEQAGAFAADGYARVTGQPGVICTTAGPGATNALTGIGEAWGEIHHPRAAHQRSRRNHDRLHEECGRYHEIDLESIFRPCTKYAATVMDNGHIPDMVAHAFRAMTTVVGHAPLPYSCRRT